MLETILAENDRTADRNRADFAAAGVVTVNLMSSPGAGKTTLLKRTITDARRSRLRLGILEGDIATSLDADELTVSARPVALVNTSAGFGGECHLDATMVRSGLGRLPLRRARPADHRERRQPRVPGRVRRRPARPGDGLRRSPRAKRSRSSTRSCSARATSSSSTRSTCSRTSTSTSTASSATCRDVNPTALAHRSQRPHRRRASTSGATGCETARDTEWRTEHVSPAARPQARVARSTDLRDASLLATIAA